MRNFSKTIYTAIGLAFLASCSSTTNNHARPSEKQLAEDKKVRLAHINIQLGNAYLESQDMQHAKEKFLHATQSAPDLPEAWYSMAYFLEKTGDINQADQDYLKAIALAPSRGDTQNDYGTFLCRQGKYNDALQHFQLAIQDPTYLDTAGAYENAAICSLRIPNDKLAAQYFDKAIREDPNRPLSLYNLAKLYYKFGKYQDANIELQDYALIASPEPATLLLSAQIAKKTGDRKQFVEATDVLKEKFPDSKETQQALRL